MREKLDSETERWGIKVTNVEIREIEPPPDIQEAMNRQMSAERVRRAVVREAEGTREAAVTVAEGEKRSAILKAEGARQAEILTAEGDQQAAVLRAEGYSTALDKIHSVAKGIDSNTLSLQYFNTLKEREGYIYWWYMDSWSEGSEKTYAQGDCNLKGFKVNKRVKFSLPMGQGEGKEKNIDSYREYYQPNSGYEN